VKASFEAGIREYLDMLGRWIGEADGEEPGGKAMALAGCQRRAAVEALPGSGRRERTDRVVSRRCPARTAPMTMSSAEARRATIAITESGITSAPSEVAKRPCKRAPRHYDVASACAVKRADNIATLAGTSYRCGV
jgi:hypothetical protein